MAARRKDVECSRERERRQSKAKQTQKFLAPLSANNSPCLLKRYEEVACENIKNIKDKNTLLSHLCTLCTLCLIINRRSAGSWLCLRWRSENTIGSSTQNRVCARSITSFILMWSSLSSLSLGQCDGMMRIFYFQQSL